MDHVLGGTGSKLVFLLRSFRNGRTAMRTISRVVPVLGRENFHFIAIERLFGGGNVGTRGGLVCASITRPGRVVGWVKYV